MLTEMQTLLDRLAAADHERQKEAGGIFLLRCVKWVCAFVLVAFVLDVILHLNAGWRLTILLVLVLVLVVLASIAWYLAFVRRNRAENIARLLEARDSALGSRLINLLQLSEQSGDASLAPFTRELARQAVENYAATIRNVPLERLARTDALQRHLRRSAIALLVFTAVLAAVFRISGIEIARFVDPFGDHPPYSFTHLAIVEPGPAGTNVLYDKGIVLRVKATGHQPREIFLTSFPLGHREQSVTVPMFEKNGGGYDQMLDNIRTETLAFAHTKDHSSESKQVHIGVTMTPQVEKVFVRATPPAYTGLKSEEVPYTFKSLQALEGTELKFRLQSNRPLRDGTLELTAGDQPPQKLTLKRSTEKEVTGSFAAADSGRMRFTIKDVDGNPSSAECEGGLTVTHDLPPEIHLANPEHDCFVAMDFKLEALIEASDDYGLRKIRFFRALNGIYSAPKVFNYTNIVRDSHETSDFDFATLGVQPGDVISLFAEATDTAPQPHLARSQTIRLSVISVEDYNNFMREQTDIADAAEKYADLNQDLQNLVEQQKQLGDEIDKLQKSLAGADEKKRADLAQQLDTLIAKQNELNRKLDRQAERMENFVRENPLYDVEKDLRPELREQAQSIRQSTKTNDASALSVAQRSSPPGGRQLTREMLQDFKKASDAQVAQLGGVHEENEKQIEQRLDDMTQMQELINDFNAFESLYRTQQELAEQAKPYNRAGPLTREDQLALKDLAATEKKVSDALDQLRDRLRDDSAAAEKLFPKAAQSGRDLAAKIADNRLKPLADQAAGQMLAGNGEQSFDTADRLRSEMEKMFTQCESGNCPNSGELDTYLRLQKMNPGSTFAQMSRSRKFGLGSGNAQGDEGQGDSGRSGYAMVDGSNMQVLGNEMSSHNSSKGSSRQSSKFGKGGGAALAGGQGQTAEPDTLKGLNPVNRQSSAVSSESVIEEYNDVVENYFKTITTRKDPANENQK